MKYSKYKTLRFAITNGYQNCLTKMNQLATKEGFIEAMPVFINDEVVLDTDCVERKVCAVNRVSPAKSMDCICIIESEDNLATEILLIELRFNYVNMKNLDKKDLYGKVEGTTLALKNPNNIHNKHYFIFNTDLKNQAVRRFRNMAPSMPQNFVATDLQDLKSIYF